MPPTRLPTCRQLRWLRCCIGVLACASRLIASPAHITTALAVPCCREYPTTADAYDLVEECGRGVSATVSRTQPRMVQALVVCSTCICLPLGRLRCPHRACCPEHHCACCDVPMAGVPRHLQALPGGGARTVSCGPVLAWPNWRLGGGLWRSCSLQPPLCPAPPAPRGGRIQLPMSGGPLAACVTIAASGPSLHRKWAVELHWSTPLNPTCSSCCAVLRCAGGRQAAGPGEHELQPGRDCEGGAGAVAGRWQCCAKGLGM